MASFLISAHGSWEHANGYTLVPTGTTVYFFSPHGSLLASPYSDFFMDLLCKPNLAERDEQTVRAQAVEVAHEGERVPNYIATGTDTDFRDVTGIYRCGAAPAQGLTRRLLQGSKTPLRTLVGGIGGDGSLGRHIYWGACREAKVKLRTVRFAGFAGTKLVEQQGKEGSGFGTGVTSKVHQLWDTSGAMAFEGDEEVLDPVTKQPLRDARGVKVKRDCVDWSALRRLKERLRAGGNFVDG